MRTTEYQSERQHVSHASINLIEYYGTISASFPQTDVISQTIPNEQR